MFLDHRLTCDTPACGKQYVSTAPYGTNVNFMFILNDLTADFLEEARLAGWRCVKHDNTWHCPDCKPQEVPA